MKGSQPEDGPEESLCLLCESPLPYYPDSARVEGDRKYCAPCITELVNSLWGSERTRLHFPERWLDGDALCCWLCGDQRDVEDFPTVRLTTTLGSKWGLMCQSCRSSDPPSLSDNSVEVQRLLAQDKADKEHYEELKPHIEDGFKQLVIYERFHWCDGREGDYAVKKVLQDIVTYLKDAHVYRLNIAEGKAYDDVGPDFQELALTWSRLVLRDLGARSWFEGPPEGEIPLLVGLTLRESGIDPAGLIPESYCPSSEKTSWVDGLPEDERERLKAAIEGTEWEWLEWEWVASDEAPEFIFLYPPRGSADLATDTAIVTLADGVLAFVLVKDGEDADKAGSQLIEVSPGLLMPLASCTKEDIERANELTESRASRD